MNKKQLLLPILIALLFSGCVAIPETPSKPITPLTKEHEEKMEAFSENVYKIANGMSPQSVKEILGEPDFRDKEADIYIRNQDDVWTYRHPVIAVARFIVIFRNDRVELSTMAVTDMDGVSHYLTREEFSE